MLYHSKPALSQYFSILLVVNDFLLAHSYPKKKKRSLIFFFRFGQTRDIFTSACIVIKSLEESLGLCLLFHCSQILSNSKKC